MNFANKKSFTLIEIVVVVMLLGVALIAVFQSLNYAFRGSEQTRYETIALNLAREGVELVGQIRDSNRLQWSGKTDLCWLKSDPYQDFGGIGCENDAWIQSGWYALVNYKFADQTVYRLDFMTGARFEFSGGINASDLKFSLCFLNDGGWSSCPDNYPTGSQGKYWRAVRVLGLYDKVGTGNFLSCPTGNTGLCGDGTAKELRFCVVVGYELLSRGKVELCSILTNFK
ncbi:MAG TPA: type II secretion system protein [Candidatus Absconditabacterales bacterium]|nr:type II secretion system protein [Candidatus Absconditabacterales bacterium]